MSVDEVAERPVRIEEAHEFDAPPEQVWRAITVPALRERWLPEGELVSPEPIAVTPNRTISYRMREPAPPFLESTVTFAIESNERGGTRLRIVHELNDARLAARSPRRPANANAPPLMRAA